MTNRNPDARELLDLMREVASLSDDDLRAYWTVDTALRAVAKEQGFDAESARQVLGNYDPDTGSVDGE